MDTKLINDLTDRVGSGKVFNDDATLRSRAHDYWVVANLREWRGDAPLLPGLVVRPSTVEDVQKTVHFATENQIPLMPFGLGSGVCAGVAPEDTTLLLDMSSLNQTRFIDETNLLAGFDAGKNGLEAEEAVAEKCLTIGHWPQSIALSSVGGWVSTRASGQFSTAYGNIEDIVYDIEAVLPNGELVTLGKAPRAAAGPDLRHLLMGAEGTMGVITGVTLALRRAPEKRAFSAFYAPTMQAGFEMQRQLVHAEWRPPVMRQYDHPEVDRLFKDHVKGEDALLLLVHEGPEARVNAELAATSAIAANAGLTKADAVVCEQWLERRNHVPNWQELFEQTIIADTVEVAAKWTDINVVYEETVASLKQVPGVVNASAHSSHVYQTGINLYFTFAALNEDPQEMEKIYFECWDRVMKATAKNGGGIAHHHGAGRLRKPYLPYDLGEGGVDLLRSIKSAVDPNGIMNPGNLIPD